MLGKLSWFFQVAGVEGPNPQVYEIISVHLDIFSIEIVLFFKSSFESILYYYFKP